MASERISPLILDGLSKYLSIATHRFIEYAIFAFVELNLADRLVNAVPDQGLTVQEIMSDERSSWNADLLYRVLRSCADGGIVERINDDKHFVLSQSGRMLTSDHPSHARDFLRWILGPLNSNAGNQLPNLVCNEGTGSGFTRFTDGLDLYTFLCRSDQSDLMTIFNGAMTTVSAVTGTKLVINSDFGRFATLVDIGGSSGIYLAQILEHYPSIEQGIVFELPGVINQVKNGEEFKLRNIPESRYKFVAGDMFDSSTIPQGDAYVLKTFLHCFDNEKVIAILSSIRKANQNRIGQSLVSLFIVEYIIFPDRAMSNWQSHAFDIAMAYAFEGACERTQQEYEQLLETTGFKLKKLYPIQAPHSIIEAVLIN
ncbi:unnamed protein product [Rotaria sordida]|uniref:O-methyltransferase C-terminal domain-containing protein n=1 Tax=Rotaria sordida TaxID=392033 RepID=A0A819UJJ5_9BILA|nr:unnamed protein product [Rotaria sordida]CAF4178453.1 unnamed protein product [Rotaria sordida]